MREREVRDDAERLVRPRKRARICSNDARGRKPTTQSPRVPLVELDGDDVAGTRNELSGDDAVARADLDDEIPARYPRVSDEFSGEARGKKVPSTRTNA
jgi:hypothetical protein